MTDKEITTHVQFNQPKEQLMGTVNTPSNPGPNEDSIMTCDDKDAYRDSGSSPPSNMSMVASGMPPKGYLTADSSSEEEHTKIMREQAVTSFKNAPQEMKDAPRWILWRSEPNEDPSKKNKKMPYPLNFRDNRGLWVTFDEAVRRYGQSYQDHLDGVKDTIAYDGIGFVTGGGFTCIDLDDCDADQESQKRTDDILGGLYTFTEESVSGKGVHAWMLGVKPQDIATRRGNVEVYSDGQFIAFTGKHLPKYPKVLSANQGALDEVCNHYLGKGSASTTAPGKPPTLTHGGYADLPELTLEEVLAKAFNSSKGEQIRKVYEGDISDFDDDDSRADLFLAGSFAFYTKDDDLVTELCRKADYRELDDEKRTGREDYWVATLGKVRDNQETYWDPNYYKEDDEEDDPDKYLTLYQYIRKLGFAWHPVKKQPWNYAADESTSLKNIELSMAKFRCVPSGTQEEKKDHAGKTALDAQGKPIMVEGGSKGIDVWKNNVDMRLPIEGTIWDAGKSNGLIEQQGTYFWNRYKDTRLLGVEPPQEYLDALETFWLYFVPDTVQREFVRNLEAYHRQNPGFRAALAIEFHSNLKGTGKSEHCESFGRIMGHDKYTAINLDEINGQFNSYLSSCLVLFADETTSKSKYDAHHLTNQLKKLISDSSIEINVKYGGKGRGTMQFLLMLATNNSDSIDHAELRERVYNVQCSGRGKDRTENTKILQELLPWPMEKQDAWYAWVLDQRVVPEEFKKGMAAPYQPHVDELISQEEEHELPNLFLEYLQDLQKERANRGQQNCGARVVNPCPAKLFLKLFADFRKSNDVRGNVNHALKQLQQSGLFTKNKKREANEWEWANS